MNLDSRRLPWQQPIQSKQSQVYVYSEKELISALGLLSKNGNCHGKSIIIVDDIVLSKTLTLSTRFDGLSIVGSGAGKAKLSCSSIIIDGEINDFCLSGLEIAPSAAVALNIYATRFEYSNLIFSFSGTGGSLISTGSSGLNSGKISDCKMVFVSGSRTAFLDGNCESVSFLDNDISSNITIRRGSSNIIRGNRMGTANITCDNSGGFGGYNVITGNTVVGSINTSSSDGSNTIVGNTAVTAITPNGTDQVGLNT